MFETIKLNVDWGLLIGIASLLITLIILIAKLFKRKSKDIEIRNVITHYIINKPSEYCDDLQIIFKGAKIESFQVIQIFLKNIGAEILNENDFNHQPTIELSGFNNILNYNIVSSCKYVKINSHKIDENKLELRINNFESNCYLKIEIAFESIEAKQIPYFIACIKNQKKIEHDLGNYEMDIKFAKPRDYNLFLPSFLLVFVISVFLIKLLVKNGLGIDLSNPGNFSLGWKIIYFLPPSIISLLFAWRFIRFLKKGYGEWNKIKKWY